MGKIPGVNPGVPEFFVRHRRTYVLNKMYCTKNSTHNCREPRHHYSHLFCIRVFKRDFVIEKHIAQHFV